MSDLDLATCVFPGCDLPGVFDGAQDDGTPGKWCFAHDPGALEPTDDDLRAIEDEAPTWNDDLVAGLAAILLDHTAMSLDTADDAVEAAMRSLAEATNMPLDFAAGILLATSWMATTGELLSEELSAGADLFEAQATDDPIPLQPSGLDPDDDDDDDTDDDDDQAAGVDVDTEAADHDQDEQGSPNDD